MLRINQAKKVARKRNSNSKSYVKAQISVRLRQIRLELFGEHGGPELARRLDLPARTWYNYETGVTVPAEVMLSFINQTGINPAWLLTGEGHVFREPINPRSSFELSPLQTIRQAVDALELEFSSRDNNSKALNSLLRAEVDKSFISLPLIEMDELIGYQSTPFAQRDQFMTLSDWIPRPDNSICVNVNSSAMSPVISCRSIVVVDLSQTDPKDLNGKIVIGLDQKSQTVIRRLEHSGDLLILRAEQSGREFPMIPFTLDESADRILGEVIVISSPLDY
ncbi:MAG: hypothetical protein DWI24_08950 [Planctomycetota bacterium]|nr:MAG: hypothetical protein DWI24_08950 [Planctomycetota bacterium]